jgi:hypothetical protein
MAQGNRRPTRHGRQQSRVAALVNTSEKRPRNSSNVSDEATVNYIKRVLCRKTPSANQADSPDEVDLKPLEELLPPLTSSNEVDVQLYALIAVVLNLFVQTWYNKITPDQDFVANVVQIIAHCTRGLEQRLRDVDLEGLILEELPTVLNEHIDGQSADSGSQLLPITNAQPSYTDSFPNYAVVEHHEHQPDDLPSLAAAPCIDSYSGLPR